MKSILALILFGSLGLFAGCFGNQLDTKKGLSTATDLLFVNLLDMIDEAENAKKEIERLDKVVSGMKAHAHVEPSHRGVVACIKNGEITDRSDEENQNGEKIPGLLYNEVTIEFNQPYSEVPHVITSIQKLQLGENSTYIFEQSVVQVSKSNFTVRCSTLNVTDIREAAIQYLAIPVGF